VFYPTGVIAISDILTINSDLGNKIPDRSWMIYMLELSTDKGHNPYPVPLELDLFCQFDNNNEFKAVFNGNNQYTFPNILPEISNSYLREIILNTDDRIINYRLTDLKTRQSESFALGPNTMYGANEQIKNELIKVLDEVKFEPYKHFTGIEWRNIVGTESFLIRYQVRFSMLRYADHNDSSLDLQQINYKPYATLRSDTDAHRKLYPISFQNPKEMDSCICYDISSGNSTTGLSYSL
jgi:hypothetical protein